MCALQKAGEEELVRSIDRGRYSLFFICSSVTCVEEKRSTRYVDGVKQVSFGALSFWHESTKNAYWNKERDE